MPSSSDPRPPPQDPSRRPRVPGVESTDGPAQRGEAGLWEVVLLACVRFSWGSGPGTLAPHWADSCPSPSRGARRARAGTAGGQGAPQSWQGAEGPCRGEGWHPAGRGWAWGAGPAPLPAEPQPLSAGGGGGAGTSRPQLRIQVRGGEAGSGLSWGRGHPMTASPPLPSALPRATPHPAGSGTSTQNQSRNRTSRMEASGRFASPLLPEPRQSVLYACPTAPCPGALPDPPGHPAPFRPHPCRSHPPRPRKPAASLPASLTPCPSWARSCTPSCAVRTSAFGRP